MQARFKIEFPPTVNHIWKRGKGRTYLTKQGREWYARQVVLLQQQLQDQAWEGSSARVAVRIDLHAPNKRKWDIDNRTKCVFDALVKAGVLKDDELIDDLRVVRGEVDPEKKGFALVAVGVLL